MTPFEIPHSMEDFVDACPSVPDLLTIANEGGSDACAALARTWISEGIPVAFKDCPAIYDSMRVWLADQLNIHAKQIGLTGSARLGSSFVPKKAAKPFGPSSDLDLFVISETLFAAYRADFFTWCDDFHSGRVAAYNATEQRYWENNAKETPHNIKRRFIDVGRRIPSHRRYKTAQQTLNTMFQLTRKLKATPRSPSPVKASVRCYEDWESFVEQVSLSLKHSSKNYLVT